MTTPDFYMNVWRSAHSDHQWTDVGVTHDELNTRDFADRVAADIASRPHTGIHRLGILRVTLKSQRAEGGAA